MTVRLGQDLLEDKFPRLIQDFFSYENKQDITSTYPNILQPGSQNMFIIKTEGSDRPSKLTVRGGMEQLGQAPFYNVPIRSEYDEIRDKEGNALLLREIPVGGADRDVVQVYLQITNTWYNLTESTNPIPTGTHKWDFQQWWDVKNLQSRAVMVNGSRKVMCWTTGYAAVTSVGSFSLSLPPGITWESRGFVINSPSFLVFQGQRFDISGGWNSNTLTLVQDPTGIIVPGDYVFQGIRFDDLTGQDAASIINFNMDVISGYLNHMVYSDEKNATVYYSQIKDQDDYTLFYSSLSGTFDIHEVVTGGTSGATGIIGADNGTALDVYGVTGTFQIGETITGNDSGASATIDSMFDPRMGETTFAGQGLNNGTFTGMYTGNDQTGNYQVTIDSITPGIDQQFFSGSGMNDIYFNTSGYTGGTIKNTYRVIIVADYGFTFVGVPAITPNPGDILTGSVSNAIGRVAFLDSGGQDPALVMLSPQGFVPGDVISGPQGTPYGTVATAVSVNWFQLFKNGVSITPTAYVPFVAYQLSVFNPVLFTDGLSFSFTNTTGHRVGDYWELVIQGQGPDTFSWFKNGVIQADTVPISSANTPILLDDGVYIVFTTTTGHIVGDTYTVICLRAITDAWRDVSFTQPIRFIGEGFLSVLDSPPIDMLPQEDGIYFNTKSGSWTKTTFESSADLQNETITLQKLKSQYQNKMLANGLINYDLNSIIYITQDKTVLSLGRLQLLEEPQNALLSDPVKYDFQFADFTDGDIKLWSQFMLFTAPKTGLMYVFDLALRIWQPPQLFSDPIAKMSILDGQIVGHSYINDTSYKLFKGTNDNGAAFTTRVVLPYYVYGSRDIKKKYSMTWAEGYVTGAPQIVFTVKRGLAGCRGTDPHMINPIMCVPPDTASLGSGSLGLHSLGSDSLTIPSKFREVYKYASPLVFYEANMELECSSLDQDWQLLSIGINVVDSEENNDEIVSNLPIHI